MKNKGFTLVELLGVIVILAIIALIAVPVVTGVIDKARKRTLLNSGYGLVEAGNLYNAQFQNTKIIRFDIKNDEVTSEEENKIKYKGSIKEGTVLVNKKGKVTICINDGKYAAYKNFDDNEVIIVDNKTCTIPENSNVVYLDNEATIDTNIEDLLKRIEILENNDKDQKEEISKLKSEKANGSDVNTLISELESKNATLTSEIAILKQNSTTLDKVYPVGSIYISTSNVNPSSLFGGTWEKYASGRTLIGEGTGTDINNNSFAFTLGATQGEYYHKLTVAEMPNHNHAMVFNGENLYFAYGDQNAAPFSGRGVSSTEGRETYTAGGDQYHNNVQPYIVVSIWKRVS